ncbi:MAG: hypothetical protein ACLR8U_00225 [Oscillospiraceae bacterium]
MEDGALRDGFHAFPLAVQHDSSDHQQGIRQREMGISWDASADSNRGSSLQSPTINTVGDDAHIVTAKCISETRKSSANSLSAQGVDVGIEPLRTIWKITDQNTKNTLHGPMQRVLIMTSKIT